jgi:hypothetical protein
VRGGLYRLVALGLAASLLPALALADTDGRVPERALAALAEIQRRGGDPPPGHVGGRSFHNRERRLPRGTYREYDVNPLRRGRPRDAERIVIEQRTGKAYYTGDHYRTFLPMNSSSGGSRKTAPRRRRSLVGLRPLGRRPEWNTRAARPGVSVVQKPGPWREPDASAQDPHRL